PPRDGVLVHVGVDGVDGGLLDEVGRREIGEALREVHRAVDAGQPRHLADHRLGEVLRAAGDAVAHGRKSTRVPVVDGIGNAGPEDRPPSKVDLPGPAPSPAYCTWNAACIPRL